MDTPETIAAEYLRPGTVIDIGSAIRRGWALVMANAPILIGATVLSWVVAVGLALIPIAGWLVGPLLAWVMHAGLSYMFVRRIRGEEVQIGDLFAGFHIALLNIVLAGLLMSALTGVGFILCLLPGIYLAVGYVFALTLVIDKKMDFWPAMEVSRQVVHKNWWSMFLLVIVLGLIVCAGVLACIVGLIIAVPVSTASLMFVYEDFFGRRASEAPVAPGAPGAPVAPAEPAPPAP